MSCYFTTLSMVLVHFLAEMRVRRQNTFHVRGKFPLTFSKAVWGEKTETNTTKKQTQKPKVFFRMETRAYCSENAGHITGFFINTFGINCNRHCVHNVPCTKNSQQTYLLMKVML